MTPLVIAVVDDDPLVLKIMTVLLTRNGYEVLLWSEAETACTMIRQQRPHLVLLDLYMQGDPSAGLKILEQLHEDPTTTTIPVIIVSGTADTLRGEDHRLATLAYARLVKPVPFEALLDRVATALHQGATWSGPRLGSRPEP